MTLKDFRKMFVEVTGRFDLVQDSESFQDAGADFFIKAGHRFLNSRFQVRATEVRVPLLLKKDTHTYPVAELLSVTGLQVNTPESGWVTLEQVDLEEILELGTSEESSKVPRLFSVINLLDNPIAEQPISALKKLGVRVFPTPEEDLTAQITGRWANVPQEDTDTSFWTLNYPELAISAAQYQIEVFHRNTQGANDHLIAIDRLGTELEHDLIESEFQSTDVMRDSFKFRGKGNAR